MIGFTSTQTKNIQKSLSSSFSQRQLPNYEQAESMTQSPTREIRKFHRRKQNPMQMKTHKSIKNIEVTNSSTPPIYHDTGDYLAKQLYNSLYIKSKPNVCQIRQRLGIDEISSIKPDFSLNKTEKNLQNDSQASPENTYNYLEQSTNLKCELKAKNHKIALLESQNTKMKINTKINEQNLQRERQKNHQIFQNYNQEITSLKATIAQKNEQIENMNQYIKKMLEHQMTIQQQLITIQQQHNNQLESKPIEQSTVCNKLLKLKYLQQQVQQLKNKLQMQKTQTECNLQTTIIKLTKKISQKTDQCKTLQISSHCLLKQINDLQQKQSQQMIEQKQTIFKLKIKYKMLFGEVQVLKRDKSRLENKLNYQCKNIVEVNRKKCNFRTSSTYSPDSLNISLSNS